MIEDPRAEEVVGKWSLPPRPGGKYPFPTARTGWFCVVFCLSNDSPAGAKFGEGSLRG